MPNENSNKLSESGASGPTQTLPVCPYCGTSPAKISSVPFQMGNMTAMALFCGNLECRKIFTVALLEIRAPQIETPQIVMPGGRRN